MKMAHSAGKRPVTKTVSHAGGGKVVKMAAKHAGQNQTSTKEGSSVVGIVAISTAGVTLNSPPHGNPPGPITRRLLAATKAPSPPLGKHSGTKPFWK